MEKRRDEPDPTASAGGDVPLQLREPIGKPLESFFKGKPDVVRLALVCLLSEGHLLIDDAPGVGKTSLAKAIAQSISATSGRIQFTPDLLPSDITGTEIYNLKSGDFEFRPGPVFANLVVVDEINRASPKTQAALLEVMEERQVTVDGRPHMVPRPFMVIATQNPVKFDGTYHLPEAQIDRFMMRIGIGYPSREAESEISALRTGRMTVEQIKPVLTLTDAQRMIDIAASTHVAPALRSYVVAIVSATRSMPELRLGASPRGSLSLVVAGQTFAASQGRSFVTADDLKLLAPYVLSHRLLTTTEAELGGRLPRGSDRRFGHLGSRPRPSLRPVSASRSTASATGSRVSALRTNTDASLCTSGCVGVRTMAAPLTARDRLAMDESARCLLRFNGRGGGLMRWCGSIHWDW